MKAAHFLFILSISLLLGCTPFVSKDISKTNGLKIAIANSIEIPTTDGDTVIYKPESDAPICHHITQHEHLKFFHPHLEKEPYKDILFKEISKPILFVKDDEMYNTYVYNQPHSKDKIYMIISGYMNKPNQVDIYENYYCNRNQYSIKKRFTYHHKQWSYIIFESDTIKL